MTELCFYMKKNESRRKKMHMDFALEKKIKQ